MWERILVDRRVRQLSRVFSYCEEKQQQMGSFDPLMGQCIMSLVARPTQVATPGSFEGVSQMLSKRKNLEGNIQ